MNLFFFLAWLGKYKDALQGAANFSYHGNIYGCMVVKVFVIASNKVGNEEQKELYENKTIGYLIIVML